MEDKQPSMEDIRIVWDKGTLNINSGVLRFSQHTKDFNKRSQRQTHPHIRMMEKTQKFEGTILEIAGAIATPLTIDTAT